MAFYTDLLLAPALLVLGISAAARFIDWIAR